MMRRENRFLVIKRADIDKYLTEDEQLKLHTYAAKVDIQRLKQDEKLAKSYVVVAENWPMYEDTWKAIEQYVDTGAYTRTDTQEVEQLRHKNCDLMGEAKRANFLLSGVRKELEIQSKHARYNNDIYYEEMEAHKECRQERDSLADKMAAKEKERFELSQELKRQRHKTNELAAYVERLRRASNNQGLNVHQRWEVMSSILSETPQRSLADHDKQIRDEVAKQVRLDTIDECAIAAESDAVHPHVVEAIRSLKTGE